MSNNVGEFTEDMKGYTLNGETARYEGEFGHPLIGFDHVFSFRNVRYHVMTTSITNVNWICRILVEKILGIKSWDTYIFVNRDTDEWLF